MGHFKNLFRTYKNRGSDTERFQQLFLDDDPACWDAEDGGGILQYFTDDGLEYNLVIDRWKGIGILIKFGCRNLNSNQILFCQYAVGDVDLLDQFEERDEWSFPKGCFISGSQAWLVVEDFLKAPTRPSARIKWVDDAEIAWPDPP